MAPDRLPPSDDRELDHLDEIFRARIRPVVFPSRAKDDAQPTLVLLGGQAGSGKSRVGARLAGESETPLALLSGDDLRSFHPDYRRLIDADPEKAGPVLARATRAWVRAAISEALETRTSLLLEGSFGDPKVTLATAERFRSAGFHVRIVGVASPRVLSLVTSASRYLRGLNSDEPARFTSLQAHDRGYYGTAELIAALRAVSSVDRVTILSRGGQVLHDSIDHAPEALSTNAETALHDGRHPQSWGARSTMELLGELKQCTNFALADDRLTPALAEILEAAHAAAIQDVAPRITIDADSPQARFIRQAIAEQASRLSLAQRVEAVAASSASLDSGLDLGR